jgi:hypothetical protein
MPCSCANRGTSLGELQLEWKLRALWRWYTNAPARTVGMTLGIAGVGAVVGFAVAHAAEKNELAGAKIGAVTSIGLGLLALMALPAT